VTTLDEAYVWGKKVLARLSHPELDARVLLRACLSLSEEEFFTRPERLLTARQIRRFDRSVRKRADDHPLAYLTRHREFWSLPFFVKPGVLIPRPETELLVAKTVELSDEKTETIVEIGTGCGVVAVCLAIEIPQAEVLATDISRRALRIARTNSRSNGQSRIRFFHGDLFSPFRQKQFVRRTDFIVSNPPYLSESEWLNCPPEISNHEPKQALVSGETGLEFITRLIDESASYLKPGGYLLFEIGAGQMERILPLFGTRWDSIENFPDLAGIPRVVAARAIV